MERFGNVKWLAQGDTDFKQWDSGTWTFSLPYLASYNLEQWISHWQYFITREKNFITGKTVAHGETQSFPNVWACIYEDEWRREVTAGRTSERNFSLCYSPAQHWAQVGEMEWGWVWEFGGGGEKKTCIPSPQRGMVILALFIPFCCEDWENLWEINLKKWHCIPINIFCITIKGYMKFGI